MFFASISLSPRNRRNDQLTFSGRGVFVQKTVKRSLMNTFRGLRISRRNMRGRMARGLRPNGKTESGTLVSWERIRGHLSNRETRHHAQLLAPHARSPVHPRGRVLRGEFRRRGLRDSPKPDGRAVGGAAGVTPGVRAGDDGGAQQRLPAFGPERYRTRRTLPGSRRSRTSLESFCERTARRTLFCV